MRAERGRDIGRREGKGKGESRQETRDKRQETKDKRLEGYTSVLLSRT